AKGTFYAQTEGRGDISLDENLTVLNNLSMQTERGDITVGKDITSKKGSVSMQTGTGDITVGADVKAGKDATMNAKSGNVMVGVNGEGSVTAGKNIAIAIADGDLDIATSLVSNGGNVTAKLDKGSIYVGDNGPDDRTVYADGSIDMSVTDGNIVIHGKTETAKGDITMQAHNEKDGQNLVIAQNGKLLSGRDLTMKTYNGTILVTEDTAAKRNLKAEIENEGDIIFLSNVNVKENVSASAYQGSILIGNTIKAGQNIDMVADTGYIFVGESVKAGQDIGMKVREGDIFVGDDVTSEHGGVSMQVETGDVMVGLIDSGRVTAEKDVSIAIGTGDLDIATSVESKQGSVTAKIGSGDIHIGDNGPGVETVAAMKNVALETGDGKIEVFGKTSTQTGDITLKAASKEYKRGEDGHNIIIDHSGEIASGNDVTLVAKNGDLHVTDRISAQRSISVITQNQGDVYLDRDVDANPNDGSVILKADKGNITASIDPATNSRYKITAGDRIEAYTQEGDITIGTAEAGQNIGMTTGSGDIMAGTARANNVSLISHGENGHVTVGEIYAQASGNSNGTGAADVTLGGSYVKVGSITNEGNGSAPLSISAMGYAADKPMKDFSIGVRNADGSYSGGISSASGAVVQQLWTYKGLIYMNGDSNLHISKLVVNDKLHTANQNISVGVFGRPPTHDGERVVYWNNSNRNNPAGAMSRWYSGSYSDSGWMYLDLFYNGNIGSRYGVLVDAHGYRNLYGDSISVVDTMRRRLNAEANGDGVVYYNRSNLIQFGDDANIADALAEELTVDE
ncbi:MAG: hypothetical protein J6F33_09125, partial [Acidaminococcaceae bacterium]|nr:hypothetical protein [Acidaminococcaceae bacterium]